MTEDTGEGGKLKFFEKFKGIPKRIKEKIGLVKKKEKKLLGKRFLKPKKKKSPPMRKRIIAFLSRSKEIPTKIKDILSRFLGGVKSFFVRTGNSIMGFFLSIVNIPKAVAEKGSNISESTKNLYSSSVERTKSLIKQKKKEIEESPLFIKKYLVDIRPVEKSLMVTAKKPAVFYWIKEDVKKIGKTLPVESVDKKSRIRKLKENILEELDDQPLHSILVRCIELARLTGKNNDIEWMEKELNGYSDVDGFVKVGRDYPEYRQTKAILPVNWYIKGEYSLINEEISLPFFCVRSVHWIEEILERCKETGSKEIMIKLSMPKELSILRDYYKKDAVNVKVPVTSLEFVLNGIKVRIHDFMYRITTEQIKKRRRKKHLKK